MVASQITQTTTTDQPIIMYINGEVLGSVIGRMVANKQILIDHRNLVNA